MNPTFVRLIWMRPHDSMLRIVYADWLDEHGFPAAAMRQRHNAKLILRALIIVRIVRINYILGLYNPNKPSVFRIKPSGSIIIYPNRASPFEWISPSSRSNLHFYRGRKLYIKIKPLTSYELINRVFRRISNLEK